MQLCTSLESILEQLDIFHVDFFVLDVEGGELEVLKSIDFDQVTFGVLCVENHMFYAELVGGQRAAGTNTMSGESAIQKLLESKGYVLDTYLEPNMWFIRSPDLAPYSESSSHGRLIVH